MYPAKFDFHRPTTVSEALSLLESLGDQAKLLAGGHSLLPMMKLRLAAPEHLVDLAGISELRMIAERDGWLEVGAMARHWEVHASPIVQRLQPLLSMVAGKIADPQVRNRGTIAGSLVHADPAADYPAAAMALNAEILCVGSAGSRIVPISEWFLGMMTPALNTDEIVVQVRFPPRPVGSLQATYFKHQHPASRFAMVGVAAQAICDDQGRCQDIRVGVTGVGVTAYRAASVEAALLGQYPDATLIDVAAMQADAEAGEVTPGFQLSPEGKTRLCTSIIAKVLQSILLRAS